MGTARSEMTDRRDAAAETRGCAVCGATVVEGRVHCAGCAELLARQSVLEQAVATWESGGSLRVEWGFGAATTVMIVAGLLLILISAERHLAGLVVGVGLASVGS